MNMNRMHYISGWILGSFLIAGCSTLPATISDTIYRKSYNVTNASPTEKDITAYLFGGKGRDCGMDIRCANDGTCLLFGESNYSFGSTVDYLAVKTSPSHDIVWAKTYDGSGSDRAISMAALTDGGYLLVGLSKSMLYTPLKVFAEKPFYYPLIIRINSSGDVVWARSIEYGYRVSDFYVFNVIQTADGGFVITGYRTRQDKSGENVLFKLSENGDYLWGNTYRSPEVNAIEQLRVIEDSDRRLNVFFEAEDSIGLFTTDQYGKPLWAKTYKGGNTKLIKSGSYAGTNKEGFIIAATNIYNTNSDEKWDMDLAVLRITAQGKILWSRQYDVGENIVPRAVMEGYDSDLVITGAVGAGSLGFVYGGSPEYPLNIFALRINENGNMEQYFISTEKPGDCVRSMAKARGAYLLFGDLDFFDGRINWLLSLWQPQMESTRDMPRNPFSQRPLDVEERDLPIEASPERLDSREQREAIKVQALKIGGQ